MRGQRFYELLLSVYPRDFRRRFGSEMAEVFNESLVEKRSPAGRVTFWMSTVVDTFASGLREHLAQFRFRRAAPVLAAACVALAIGDGDVHASEVQGTVLLLLICTGGFSLVQPKRAWLWFLLFGLSVPAWHYGRAAAGLPPTYPVHPGLYATFLAMIPAAIGAAVGGGCRMMTARD